MLEYCQSTKNGLNNLERSDNRMMWKDDDTRCKIIEENV